MLKEMYVAYIPWRVRIGVRDPLPERTPVRRYRDESSFCHLLRVVIVGSLYVVDPRVLAESYAGDTVLAIGPVPVAAENSRDFSGYAFRNKQV